MTEAIAALLASALLASALACTIPSEAPTPNLDATRQANVKETRQAEHAAAATSQAQSQDQVAIDRAVKATLEANTALFTPNPATPTLTPRPYLPPTAAPIRRITLDPGDCIQLDHGTPIPDPEPTKVPCDGEWTHRVLNSFTVQDPGPFPEDPFYFLREALQHCNNQFTNIIRPTNNSWLAGDRTIDCLQNSFGLSVTHPAKLDRLVNRTGLANQQCARDAPETEYQLIEIVPCSDLWEYRLLNTFPAQDSETYPDPIALERQALQNCNRRHTWTLLPSERTWLAGDRTIFCLQENVTNTPGISPLLNQLIDPLTLNPGECANAYETNDHSLAQLVSCSDQWEVRVTQKVEILKDQPYPGDEQMLQATLNVCGPDSTFHLYPDLEMWNLGLTTIFCYEAPYDAMEENQQTAPRP